MSSRGTKGKGHETSEALESGVAMPQASGLLEAFSFYGLVAAIVVLSIPYGSVDIWYRSLLIVLISVLAGSRLIDSVLRGSFKVAEWRMLLPLFGVLVLGFFQMVQWPGMAAPISADPYETWSFLVFFGALLVAAEILLTHANSKRRLTALVVLVIAVGTGSSIFGLLREFVLHADSGYFVGFFYHEQGFAQFINRNHFAVLIEMSFGLLLGILLKAKLSEKARFALWVLAGVLAYSAIAANSRGGLMGIAALSLFAAAAHILTRESWGSDERFRQSSSFSAGRIVRKLAMTTGLLAAVFGFVVFTIVFVGGDTVVTRFERLKGEFGEVNHAGVNRGLIWESTLEMIRQEPVVGIGFGGYGAAITKYDSSGGRYSLQQAHNDYLEILANGGVVGFALFAIFGVMAARRTWTSLKTGDRLIRSFRFGAAAGVFGVLIHSLVDFGLHVPINAVIFAVLVVIATVNFRSASEGRTVVRTAFRT